MIGAPSLATPYCGAPPDPATWLARWNADPLLIGFLLASLVLACRLPPDRRRYALAAAGVASLIFISPLCALSSALFAARTVHHVLLVGVLAPLLAAATASRRAGAPMLATLVQGAVFWAWHAPAAYSLALSSDLAYWLMQASLLGTALWFWSALRGAGVLTTLAALLGAMLLMGLLGAILVFAPAPLYAAHVVPAEIWGLGALRDQQAAGLIMWAPAAGLYLAAALWRLGRHMGPPSSKTAAA